MKRNSSWSDDAKFRKSRSHKKQHSVPSTTDCSSRNDCDAHKGFLTTSFIAAEGDDGEARKFPAFYSLEDLLDSDREEIGGEGGKRHAHAGRSSDESAGRCDGCCAGKFPLPLVSGAAQNAVASVVHPDINALVSKRIPGTGDSFAVDGQESRNNSMVSVSTDVDTASECSRVARSGNSGMRSVTPRVKSAKEVHILRRCHWATDWNDEADVKTRMDHLRLLRQRVVQ